MPQKKQKRVASDYKAKGFYGMLSPCYKCKDREIGCHGKCEKYIRFAEYARAESDLRKSSIDAIAYGVEKDTARRKKWHR